MIEVRCGRCTKAAVVQLRNLEARHTWYACAGHAAGFLVNALGPDLIAECLWCKESMPVPARPQGGGRTKVYCSPRCRTAAHRARPAPWGPDTLHGVAGTEKA